MPIKHYSSITSVILLILIGAFSTSGAPPGLSIANSSVVERNVGQGHVPALPEISIADTRIVEGNGGQRIAEVRVSLSKVAPATITIAYTTNTKNGTATENLDYLPAKGSIIFEKGELVKLINIQIVGEVICEEDEKFEIVLSNPSGAILADEVGTTTIENDDCYLRNNTGASAYEVRFTHTGFTTFFGGPSECPIRANGTVVLSGILFGAEKVGADDDIVYTGTLQLNMDIDLCSVDGPGDQAKLCGMRLIGSGSVNTQLEIYFDQRGGYVKIENKSGSFLQSVTGTCGEEQMDEEKGMIPNKTMASIFNGRDLPMLTNRTLSVGRYVEDDGEGNVTVVEVLRKIK
ncbi:MAG: Calx-beta domain-containing protein [Chitinophagaceae bacterium]